MSKYFSNANENKNNENIEIKIDGIRVNNEKYVMYFLLDKAISIYIIFNRFFNFNENKYK